MTRVKVAVLKTSPETVIEDYQRLFEIADIERFLEKGQTTILKDNISWHFFYPAANTTPWQLEGTILGLKAHGYDDLVCVQNDTVVTDVFKGERLNKYLPIFEHYEIPVKYTFIPEDIEWVVYEPKGRMLILPTIYPEGIKIPNYFFGKNIVHLPTQKAHIYTQVTVSMKNAFGGLLNTRRHYTHSWIHETLVDLLAIQQEIHAGIFAVVDGTICGNGPGPRTMIPVEKDYILAGADQVAIDAVAAKMMGFDPMSIKYIRLAHEMGLGVGDVSEIEIVGEDVSGVNFGFRVGDNAASRIGDLLWFSPLKIFQKLFFHTPLVYLFVFGSFLYHDYIWYPRKGKRVVAEFMRTKWGRLFANYEERVGKWIEVEVR
jgi:uncharacterized protein (DUF362 family)